jgi:hypothetical protein
MHRMREAATLVGFATITAHADRSTLTGFAVATTAFTRTKPRIRRAAAPSPTSGLPARDIQFRRMAQ